MEKYRRYIDLGYFSILLQKIVFVLYWDVDSKNWTILDKNPIQIDFAFEAIRADSLIRLFMEFSQKKY